MTGYDIVLVGIKPYDSDVGTNTINNTDGKNTFYVGQGCDVLTFDSN